MTGRIDGSKVGRTEYILIEDCCRSVDASEGTGRLVLEALDLFGICLQPADQYALLKSIQGHCLTKMVLCGIRDCVLQPIGPCSAHSRLGLEDKQLVVRTVVRRRFSEFEPDNVASLG